MGVVEGNTIVIVVVVVVVVITILVVVEAVDVPFVEVEGVLEVSGVIGRVIDFRLWVAVGCKEVEAIKVVMTAVVTFQAEVFRFGIEVVSKHGTFGKKRVR